MPVVCEAGACELDGQRQADVAQADDADAGGAAGEFLAQRFGESEEGWSQESGQTSARVTCNRQWSGHRERPCHCGVIGLIFSEGVHDHQDQTAWDVPSSEITPEHIYHSRREFMQVGAAGAMGAVAAGVGRRCGPVRAPQRPRRSAERQEVELRRLTRSKPSIRWEQITNYNNYYEFGTAKTDPAQNSGQFKTRPWTVKVDGLVGKPADYAIDDLIKMNQLEERIYRHRCVEGVVDGDSLGRDSARDDHRQGRADVAGEVRGVHDADAAERDARRSAPASPFPYIEGLRWTRRCIR